MGLGKEKQGLKINGRGVLQFALVFVVVLAIAAVAVFTGLRLQDVSDHKPVHNDKTDSEENNKQSDSKEMIDLTRLEKASGYILAYTKTGGDRTLGQSLHLAWSEDGLNFQALNSDNGICFARRIDGDHTIEDPFLFTMENGDYGVIAVSSSRPGKVAVYTSSDLVIFDQEVVLDLRIDIRPSQLQCYYDIDRSAYNILWSDGDKQFQQSTTDFKNISKPEHVDYVPWTNPAKSWPADSVPGNITGVDQATLDYIKARLLPLSNTSIEMIPASCRTQIGSKPELPASAKAYYSDGSSAQVPISWDDEGLNINESGTYRINGRIGYPEFDNPFIESKADPWITMGADGKYYFTASYPMYSADDENGYSRVTLRRADSIADLQNAEEVPIWINNPDDGIYRYIWAPEIHQINGDWYILFTGSLSPDDVFAIRPHLLKCEAGKDPMEPSSWQSEGRVKPVAGDPLAFQTFSLDMTYFEAGGRHYVVWAEKPAGDSFLFIATIDPADPSKLTSPGSVLSIPEFAWEQVRYRVNEGAAVIKKNGKVYLCFSAAGTGPEYCLGMLTADENDDLLQREAWTKNPYPILTTQDVDREYGPGHNSFTKDKYGNDIFVYHARSFECYTEQCEYAGQDPLYDPCRHARIKAVHWSADDVPVLKMTADQFVRPDLRDVAVDVIVE